MMQARRAVLSWLVATLFIANGACGGLTDKISRIQSRPGPISSQEPEYDYDEENLVDGDPSTSWQTRSGSGARLEIQFSEPVSLAAVRLRNGADYNHPRFGDLYPLNRRLRRITYCIDGDRCHSAPVADVRGWQEFQIIGEETRTFTLIADAFFEGSQFQDIAISEIEFREQRSSASFILIVAALFGMAAFVYSNRRGWLPSPVRFGKKLMSRAAFVFRSAASSLRRRPGPTERAEDWGIAGASEQTSAPSPKVSSGRRFTLKGPTLLILIVGLALFGLHNQVQLRILMFDPSETYAARVSIAFRIYRGAQLQANCSLIAERVRPEGPHSNLVALHYNALEDLCKKSANVDELSSSSGDIMQVLVNLFQIASATADLRVAGDRLLRLTDDLNVAYFEAFSLASQLPESEQRYFVQQGRPALRFFRWYL